MCWVRHWGGAVKGQARVDEVIEKKALDEFFVNTVFGRESWSCRKIQWDTDMGGCANAKRGLCWTQAQGSGWSGRKIHRVVNSDWSGLVDFSERSDRTKIPKDLGFFYCFTSWTQSLTILHTTNLSDLRVSKRKWPLDFLLWVDSSTTKKPIYSWILLFGFFPKNLPGGPHWVFWGSCDPSQAGALGTQRCSSHSLQEEMKI